MSTNTKYLLIAGAVALVFAAWVLGWKQGERQTAKDLDPLIRREAPPVTEATAEPAPAPAILAPNTSPKAASKPAPEPARAMGDPRQSGLNYLFVATLPETEARAAVEFLTTNGVQAFAIPSVDTRGASANNPSPGGKYRVAVLPGLSKKELGETVRQNMEADVVRLGQIWQKEHHGASNFAKFGWDKYQ
jgi:hypothetical protein